MNDNQLLKCTCCDDNLYKYELEEVIIDNIKLLLCSICYADVQYDFVNSKIN